MQNPLLMRALLLNGIFSSVCGIALILKSAAISNILFAVNAEWQNLTLMILGIGLVLFGSVLFSVFYKKAAPDILVRLIIAADIAWVLASILLCFLGNSLFSQDGIITVVVIASIVAIMAYLQFLGSQIKKQKSD